MPGLRAILSLGLLVSLSLSAQAGKEAVVYKTSDCLCCIGWIKHLQENGYTVDARGLSMGDLMKRKLDAGITAEPASCHSANIEGYFIEGHVPVEDIERLVRTRPVAVGLAVPGMPLGSPGMEADAKAEPYDVLLVQQNGATNVFRTYP